MGSSESSFGRPQGNNTKRPAARRTTPLRTNRGRINDVVHHSGTRDISGGSTSTHHSTGVSFCRLLPVCGVCVACVGRNIIIANFIFFYVPVERSKGPITGVMLASFDRTRVPAEAYNPALTRQLNADDSDPRNWPPPPRKNAYGFAAVWSTPTLKRTHACPANNGQWRTKRTCAGGFRRGQQQQHDYG